LKKTPAPTAGRKTEKKIEKTARCRRRRRRRATRRTDPPSGVQISTTTPCQSNHRGESTWLKVTR